MAREQRKLAAILAADVVGYSRLMGPDESGAAARAPPLPACPSYTALANTHSTSAVYPQPMINAEANE